MSKTKPIITILVLLAIAFIIITYIKDKPKEPSISLESIDTLETSSSTVETNTPTAISADASIKEKSWAVLQKYVEFAKDKDIEGVRSLSYQLTDSCKKYSTEEEKKDCDARMGTVAFFGGAFAKKDFVHVWSDNKQIILATDFRIEENEEAISKTRSMIYFVIDSGVVKILKFDPAKGTIMKKTSEVTKQERDAKLIEFTIDSDEDGAEDHLEKCLSVSQDATCTKTDPTKKDSDGDGFWDGIEALFYK